MPANDSSEDAQDGDRELRWSESEQQNAEQPGIELKRDQVRRQAKQQQDDGDPPAQGEQALQRRSQSMKRARCSGVGIGQLS